MEFHGFSLMYEGKITHEITKSFSSLAEIKMDEVMEEPNVQKRVFHVMVECLQNICKHADDEDETIANNFNTGNGIFVVGKYDDEYHVVTGNKIANNKIEIIKGILDNINSLTTEELKELYKKQMKSSAGLSDKGGAGLGFVDIARKTGNKFDYNFKPIDEKYSFFVLKSKISRTKE